MRTPSKLWATAALALPLLLSACTSGAAANQPAASNPPAASQNLAPEAPAPAAANSVFVPDVAGLPADDVERALRQLQLRPKWDKKVTKTSDWIVTGTSPKVGTALNHGSIVTLEVTKASAYKDPNYIEGTGADDPADVIKQYATPEATDNVDASDPSSSASTSPTGATSTTDTNTGSTVSCVDGTISTAGGKSGACSGHGGVAN